MTISHSSSTKMAVTMVPFWITIFISVIGSNAAGELSILHSPDSISFIGDKKVFESVLKEIYSASLGLSVRENAEWDGILINDPFNTPEAVVEVYVDGVSSLGDAAGLKAKKYSLTVDEYQLDTYDALSHRIKQRFSNGGNNLVTINLDEPNELISYPGIFDIPVPKVQKGTRGHLEHLKSSVEEDYQFLFELEALQSIINKVKSGDIHPDNVVDFYQFRFHSLHALSDFHGPNSLQAKEAKKLLGKALEDLNDAFIEAYDGSVLVTVVTTDVAHTRRTARSVADDELVAGRRMDMDAYSADYAAIFNIILWFGVVFVFTLVAIVYALIDMDPGRDSIIYRMTSTRIKKDN